jgi:hypothetical protein
MVGRIYAGFDAFFAGEGWLRLENEEAQFFKLFYDGRHGQWECFAQADEPKEWGHFYSVYPVRVPEARRAAAAELLTRINWTVPFGSFDLDWSDGEVRFRTGLDFEGSEATLSLMRALVIPNLAMMERYWPALVAVVENGLEPVAALATCV